ncbi:MAG: hypothetical protein ACK5LR_04175 [Mangrovibacterium sp.]
MDNQILDFLYQKSRTSLSMERLAALVLDEPSCMAELVDICTDTTDTEGNWRAAWLLYKVADESPTLLQTYAPRLIGFFISSYPDCPDGLLRGLLRTLMTLEYPENLCASLLDACTDIYKKQKRAKAVRVNAIKVIGKIVRIYPELAVEFIPEFELLATHDEKAVAAAARIELKKIKRLHL